MIPLNPDKNKNKIFQVSVQPRNSGILRAERGETERKRERGKRIYTDRKTKERETEANDLDCPSLERRKTGRRLTVY